MEPMIIWECKHCSKKNITKIEDITFNIGMDIHGIINCIWPLLICDECKKETILGVN